MSAGGGGPPADIIFTEFFKVLCIGGSDLAVAQSVNCFLINRILSRFCEKLSRMERVKAGQIAEAQQFAGTGELQVDLLREFL